jgi:hypothetical protein
MLQGLIDERGMCKGCNKDEEEGDEEDSTDTMRPAF